MLYNQTQSFDIHSYIARHKLRLPIEHNKTELENICVIKIFNVTRTAREVDTCS